MKNLFDIDLKGLVELIEDEGNARLIMELVRNSLDETCVTTVLIHVEPVPGRPLAFIQVLDDAPTGFRDLSHAYTLFAPSYKKVHTDKAGRWNMGDKLFLAAAIMTGKQAEVCSTTGSLVFDKQSGRTHKRVKTEKGSIVRGYLKMTRPEWEECIRALHTLLLPEGVKVVLNGTVLLPRRPVHEFQAILPTVQADSEGVLRPVRGGKETMVRVYEPFEGETPTLYELGIPVVETNDKWHVDVLQKVPLNMQRDNVPPAYLRTVRTLVFNELFQRTTEEDANQAWVREATSDPRIDPKAMEKALDARFGKERVSYDPSDPQANKRAAAEGKTVVYGNMMSRQEWENTRRTNTTPPAGQVFPSPKPFDPDGVPAERGRRCFMLEGPIPFETVGVAASITGAAKASPVSTAAPPVTSTFSSTSNPTSFSSAKAMTSSARSPFPSPRPPWGPRSKCRPSTARSPSRSPRGHRAARSSA